MGIFNSLFISEQDTLSEVVAVAIFVYTNRGCKLSYSAPRNHFPQSSMPPPSSSFSYWASNLVLIQGTYLIISFDSESARRSVVSNSL